MFGLIGFLLYVLIGAGIMFALWKLYATNSTFSTIMEQIQADEMFEAEDESFVGVCFIFALCWPLIIGALVLIYPFAMIKYLYDTKWTKDSKQTTKNDNSVEI